MTGTITVTAPSGCAWSAVSNATWITISAGASGTGNGSVTYVVAANTGTTLRTGTMTIGGITFTVTQSAVSCVSTISPSFASVVAAGTTGTVTVFATTGCNWSAVSNDAWITVTGGATGSGNGTFTYSVAANTTTVARTGTVTAGGKTFSVNQGATPCSYTLSPTGQALGSAGGSGTVTVTTTPGCNWTATGGTSWVTITSGASGSGSGSVAFTAAPNTTTLSRTAILSIAGKGFVVTEPSASCTFSVTPLNVTVPAGGGTGTIAVTTQFMCSWGMSTSASWVTLTGSATGSGTATYTVTANTGSSPRTATISIAGITINLTQDAQTGAPSPNDLNMIQ
jgi:hypothetical protein